jgi:hypothetical protein
VPWAVHQIPFVMGPLLTMQCTVSKCPARLMCGTCSRLLELAHEASVCRGSRLPLPLVVASRDLQEMVGRAEENFGQAQAGLLRDDLTGPTLAPNPKRTSLPPLRNRIQYLLPWH